MLIRLRKSSGSGTSSSKEVVEFSDLSKNLFLLLAGKKKGDTAGGKAEAASVGVLEASDEPYAPSVPSLDEDALNEFENWERKYLEAINQGGSGSHKSISDQDYEAWDTKIVQTTTSKS